MFSTSATLTTETSDSQSLATLAPELARALGKLGDGVALYSEALRNDLDAMTDQMSKTPEIVAVTVAVGSGMVASAGYVIWSARGSLLMTILIAASPLWNQFDPLVVLEGRERQGVRRWWRWRRDFEHEGGDSLQSLVRRRRSRPLALLGRNRGQA